MIKICIANPALLSLSCDATLMENESLRFASAEAPSGRAAETQLEPSRADLADGIVSIDSRVVVEGVILKSASGLQQNSLYGSPHLTRKKFLR